MEFIVIWLACGIFASMIGAKKGAKWSGLILGLALGPIGVIIAIVMKGR